METKRTRPEVKILVVDDDEAILRATSRILSSAGYETLEADTGAECLKRVEEGSPDLVVLDVVLPDMDGTEVCRRIKSRPEFEGVFVVMTSGKRISPEDQAEGLHAGADGYIARPFAKQEFLARLEAFLRIRRTEKILREREALLRETGRIARLGGWELEVDTGEVTWTEELYRIHQLEPGCEVPWLKMLSFYEPEPGRILQEALKRTTDKGEPFDLELPLVTARGIRLWIRIMARPFLRGGRTVKLTGILQDITDRKNAEQEQEKLIADLQKALAEVKTLSGLLPICASCKKVRDDDGYWQRIEFYIKERSDAEFTHSICPDCMVKLYPEFAPKPEGDCT